VVRLAVVVGMSINCSSVACMRSDGGRVVCAIDPGAAPATITTDENRHDATPEAFLMARSLGGLAIGPSARLTRD
jgi:hypothetical protein